MTALPTLVVVLGVALAGVVVAEVRCAWRDDRPVGYAGLLPRYVR